MKILSYRFEQAWKIQKTILLGVFRNQIEQKYLFSWCVNMWCKRNKTEFFLFKSNPSYFAKKKIKLFD